MPTARGTVTKVMQADTIRSTGKKAPTSVTVQHGDETEVYKSWEPQPVEVGQEVEITYENEQRGQYNNNKILGIRVLSSPPGVAAGSGGGNGGRPDAVGRSIESQVALKVAGEIVSSMISAGAMDLAKIEDAYGTLYQIGNNLLTYGTTTGADPFAEGD